MTKTKGFDWFSLIVGILSLCAAWVVFTRPLASLVTLAYLFGGFALIKGIYELWFRNTVKNTVGANGTWLLIIAIIDIILGVYLLFHIGVTTAILPYVFAVWFIADSIVELATAGIYRQFSKGYYWFIVILNILAVICGISLLFNPMMSAGVLIYLAGFYFIFFGIAFITEAF
ncbi:hypothetical protein IV38_GL001254 [Lactobacillus selangorensis]|uniref:Integral membrane protein n=1 Tax=Lactobacillus selangorensis TaxID=81857 RepID=A0A0R2FNJ1_9LACO|nr:DUF308 domain-containing protein [Lactobacillus selangorensis]KRN29038.1 hypothetical protein IV38_GL001254 [Lactobacillus selangorensis]KRN30048.1 hypothetical protein IV40_GL002077 [Lactobacillus selangorensis]